MNPLWVLLPFFGLIMLVTISLGYFLVLRNKAAVSGSQVERITLPVEEEVQETSAQYLLGRALQIMGEALPASQAEANPIRKLLICAGYRRPAAPAIFYGIKVAVMLLLAGSAGTLAYQKQGQLLPALVACSCIGIFGFRAPDRFLHSMQRARGRRLRRALPAALDVLVLSLEAGQPLEAAILDTGHELRHIHPDLSDELALMHLELRAGRSRAEALRLLAERAAEPEVTKLVNTLIDSDRFGSSLAHDLRIHAKYLRTRMRQQAQEAARKLTVKLVFPVFFLIFPSVLLVTLGPAILQMQEQLFNMIQAHP
jgi:tight adherence protein C